MFTIRNNECIGFESRWTVKKVSIEGTTQTTEFSTENKSTNTAEKNSIEIQTDTENNTQATMLEEDKVDMEKLANWLNKIYPNVKQELDEASSSEAFENYQLLGDTTKANYTLTQTINVSIKSSASDEDFAHRVSALSWNSTGNTIAVSCNYPHKSWCYHSGNNQLPELFNHRLSTESCVTVLEFHPNLPNVIAVGTYSGDIIIYNINQNDNGKESESCGNKINEHGGSITQLKWINDLDLVKTIILASSSLDGFLIIWKFNSITLTLDLKEKYKIKSPLFGRMQKSSKEINKKVVVGIVCFDFSKYIPDMFIVGTEGGLIVQCSMLGTTELKGSTDKKPILDPVFKYYEKYNSEVNSICFSPNSKELFVTSGMDGDIRIYMIDQEEPAQVIFFKQTLNCLTWIPFEEKIIAGCGNNGLIEIINIIEGKCIENCTDEKISTNILTQMVINKMRSNTVAVGTENGQLQLWNVPWNLFGSLASQ